jgi:hypothetical protein
VSPREEGGLSHVTRSLTFLGLHFSNISFTQFDLTFHNLIFQTFFLSQQLQSSYVGSSVESWSSMMYARKYEVLVFYLSSTNYLKFQFQVWPEGIYTPRNRTLHMCRPIQACQKGMYPGLKMGAASATWSNECNWYKKDWIDIAASRRSRHWSDMFCGKILRHKLQLRPSWFYIVTTSQS